MRRAARDKPSIDEVLLAVPPMKILVLATKPLAMKSGDALRFVNVARHLRSRHAFDLLCFARPGQELDEVSAAVFDRVTKLPYPDEEQKSLTMRAVDAFSPEHFMPSSVEMQAAVALAIASREYQMVFDIGGLMLSNLPQGRLSLPVVADSIDEPRITYLRALRFGPWSEKPRALRMLWVFGRVNREISARADANVYASDVDAASYARFFPRARVESIPNGVDAEHFAPDSGAAQGERIAFEGNMMFEPNIDAARRLCTEVLPLLWKAHPKLRLELIGRDPAQEVRALACERVEVSGTLPDVRGHLRRASVFVCPMRLGAGVKNKILQAWALGLPIVASTQAMSGLEARDGENVLIRDEPETFAAAVSRLLSTPDVARRLAANGRKLVVEKYSWMLQAERFERLFAELQALRAAQSR
jgi:glycosyltransferase involved in cell wall biosynthesis